jgi:hypothetical protein
VIVALAAACTLVGAGNMTAPDPACTPGAQWATVTRAQACDPAQHERRPVSAAMRRQVLARYGYTAATFHGELDHRIPVWLRGASTPANLWPEPGAIPNPKDQLEYPVLWRRVCLGQPHPMRVTTALAAFQGDWRTAYRRYMP